MDGNELALPDVSSDSHPLRLEPWLRGGAVNEGLSVPTDEKDWEYAEFRSFLDRPRNQRNWQDVVKQIPRLRRELGVREDIAGTSRMYVARLAARRDWSDRARAYDLAGLRTWEQDAPVARKDMNVRHARASDKMIDALVRPVAALIDRIESLEESGIDPWRNMPIEDLFEFVVKSARALPNLVRAERLARGESTDNVQIDIEARLRRLARERGLPVDDVIDAARRTWRPGGDAYIPTFSVEPEKKTNPMSVYFPEWRPEEEATNKTEETKDPEDTDADAD